MWNDRPHRMIRDDELLQAMVALCRAYARNGGDPVYIEALSDLAAVYGIDAEFAATLANLAKRTPVKLIGRGG